MYSLIIQNLTSAQELEPRSGVSLTRDRSGRPSTLSFSLPNVKGMNIANGNSVQFYKDGKPVFFGFIFKITEDKDEVKITAYDQMRYLKNKDTIVYTGTTADLIKIIARSFRLNTGKLINTGYSMSRIEDATTLMDMIQNSLDETLRNTKKLYTVYDDFGKIILEDVENMRLDILIDAESCESYSLDKNIDTNTYNKVKLYRNNKKTGARDIYITKDSDSMNKWGVLQFLDELKEGENGIAKANALLELYNKEANTLELKNVLGDIRVRGGSSVIVYLETREKKLSNYMLVDSVKHSFQNEQHTMDLTLRGGNL